MSEPPPRPDRANRVVLGGRVEVVEVPRVTPGGVPIVAFSITHRSRQEEAGLPREARLRMRVLAAGPLAAQAAGLPVGAEVEVMGFLSRASYRREPSHLALHAQRIQIVNQTESTIEE